MSDNNPQKPTASPPGTLEYYLSLPLVNPAVAGQVFEVDEEEDEEMAECRDELWQGVVTDLMRDLEEAIALVDSPNAVQKEQGRKLMHRIAGYTGNIGIHRLSVALRDVMKGVAIPENTPWLADHLRSWAAESLQEMRKIFPHLPD